MSAPRADRRSLSRPAKESRHRGREAALQMLYQWEVGRLSMTEVRDTHWSMEDPRDATAAEVREFAVRLADGVVDSVAQLDPMIAEAAEHWRIERMNVLDRMILR